MSAKMTTVLDLTLCQECEGRCCQGSPGVWVDPRRFFEIFFSGEFLTVEQLRDRLPALNLVLWEKSGVPIPAPRSLPKGCFFHGLDGCHLSINERPCQCLALVPNRATLLQSHACLCELPVEFSREVAQKRWQEYWKGTSAR